MKKFDEAAKFSLMSLATFAASQGPQTRGDDPEETMDVYAALVDTNAIGMDLPETGLCFITVSYAENLDVLKQHMQETTLRRFYQITSECSTEVVFTDQEKVN